MWEKAEDNLRKDKYIAPLIEKWGSCTIKPLKKDAYFADLIDAICSQQLSGKAAKTIFGRVQECVGGKIFPEKILEKEDQELRDCGLSWAKVKYVKDLADKVLKNEVKINVLDSLSDDEVVKELEAVKGIGKWTAEMFLMFSLCRQNVFPVDDLGIKKGFEKVTGIKFDKAKAAKFAEKQWGPFKTLASWYLWRSLENR